MLRAFRRSFAAAQDLRRITKSTKLPTRLHQQVRKLAEQYGVENVEHSIHNLGQRSTRFPKVAEESRLMWWYEKHKIIPEGNKKSFFGY